MIKVQCPRCKEELEVPVSLAGEKETCPICQYAVQIPPERVTKPTPTSDQTSAQDQRRESSAPPTRKQCPQCKEWIAKDANICPHCRSKQPAPAWVTIAAIVTVLVLGAWGWHSCSSFFSLSPEAKERLDEERWQAANRERAYKLAEEEAAKKAAERIQELVAQKKICRGMTTQQVIASWGKPNSVNRTVTGYGKQEQWVYEGRDAYLYFDDGILTSYQVLNRDPG
jgi:uncharacterized protein YdaU (DUF1376 family)